MVISERQRLPFPDRVSSRKFNNRFKTLVGELLRIFVAARLSAENQHTFYHGREWSHTREDGSEMTGGVKAHTAETELKFDSIVDGRLDAIADQARSILEQMKSAFTRTLYETVSAAVEEVGNVVDAKGKSTPEAFLEMLRKIEFGVDRQGNVTRPEIHLHPETAKRFIAALEGAGPSFAAEVDRLTAEKAADALSREQRRKRRFKTRDAT